uniref:Uncharacterized protein n=1 Tax=Glossina pallidipes TaxID=7398 RepID=A0A1A9ZG37_GLOPL
MNVSKLEENEWSVDFMLTFSRLVDLFWTFSTLSGKSISSVGVSESLLMRRSVAILTCELVSNTAVNSSGTSLLALIIIFAVANKA